MTFDLLLEGGECPELRTLGVEGCKMEMAAGKCFALANESGLLGQHLEEIELSCCNLSPIGFILMMTKAVGIKGPRHCLRRLALEYCFLRRHSGEPLGKPVRAKHSLNSRSSHCRMSVAHLR